MIEQQTTRPGCPRPFGWTTSPSTFVPVIAGSHSHLDIVTGERTPADLTRANLPEVIDGGPNDVGDPYAVDTRPAT